MKTINTQKQDRAKLVIWLCSLSGYTLHKFNSNHLRINSFFDFFPSTCMLVFNKTNENKKLNNDLFLDELVSFIEEKELLLLLQKASKILRKNKGQLSPALENEK